MMRIGQATLACMAVIFIAQVKTQAALVRFTDRALWEAAVVGPATEDFNSSTKQSFALGSNVVEAFDFQFTGDAFGGVRDEPLSDTVDGSNFLEGGDDPDMTMSMVFSSPVKAFFADFANVNTASGLNIVVDSMSYNLPTEFGGTVTPSGIVGGNDGSFGVVSDDSSFSLVEFVSANQAFSMDNISTATVVAIPEPASLALVSIPAWAAALAARRRRRGRQHTVTA
jgi:hypothetical protein